MVDDNNSGRVVFAHITIGLQLGITMFIFVYGGHKLDLYFDKTPIFLIIGTVTGMSTGFYHLLKSLQFDDKKKEEKHIKKRVKWN